jgi:hypothetical protein
MQRLALLFPLALLLFAGYFLLGRIGYWSDDYWHNLRDPATGELAGRFIIVRGFFLRPLFYRVVPPLTTLLWNHDWAAHLIQVLSHGLTTLLAYCLMRTLSVPARAAAASALLFMVFPPHFEAVLWISALPTSLASSLMLGLMFLTIAFARQAGPLRLADGWWVVPVMMGITFAICSLNEQPAAGVLALPLVYLCAAGLPARNTLVREGARAVIPALLCAGMVLLYAWLVRSTAIPGSRGAAGNMVTLQQLWPRSLQFGDVLWRRMVMKNFAPGALRLGLAELKAAPVALVLWGIVLAGSLVPFGRWWLRAQPAGERAGSADHGARGRRLLLAFTGLFIFASGFLPILLFAQYDPDSRTRYWPCIGLALFLGAVFPMVQRAGGKSAPGSAPAALLPLLLLIPPLLAAGVIFIGIQSAFRIRWEADQREAAQLRMQIPDPPPFTTFVPVRLDRWAVQSGSPVLDRHMRSAWEFPWSAPRHLAHTYRRTDLHCGFLRRWTPGFPVAGADERGMLYADPLGPRYAQREEAGWRIPWDQLVPFIIAEDGQLRVVTRVVIQTADGAEVEIAVPQAAHLPQTSVHLPRR